ncbi:MAG: glycosyltransferase family 1 protein [Haliangiales bacterium]
MQPLRVLDFNSLFSFSGGGIRTYHLRKLDYFSDHPEVEYHLAVPSDSDRVERHGNACLHHLATPRLLQVRNYALTIEPRRLLALVDRLQPDLIEAGGPYTDPIIARAIRRRYGGVLIGFWHTHYPSAYLDFYGSRLSPRLGRLLERIGWRLARASYGLYDAIIVAADCIIDDLDRAGLRRVIQCPLGIDVDAFHPRHADPALRARVGASERPLVFFPHRFLAEKGIRELVAAVPRVAAATGAVFAFAGHGPEIDLVANLCQRRPDCHHLGFIETNEELAAWFASSDLGYGLSAWETFGFSVVEAMASGLPLVVADRGAANDWITRAGCGLTVPHGDVDALAAATVALLQRPDRAEVGMRGREYAVAHFTWDGAFGRMYEYYRLLVESHRQGRPLTGFPYRL